MFKKVINFKNNINNNYKNNTMYNAFLVNKKQIQLQQIKKKSQLNSKYVKRYYNVTRPALIDNHNKRVNSFIRRMEQQPIQINMDSNIKNNIRQPSYRTSSNNQKRSFQNNTARKQMKSNLQHYDSSTPHPQTFKFKDIEDWQSLFTPLQRIERQRNYELFKHKYGDPTIAYRSIGSQSEYKPGHQFRDRDVSMQINPPMRYTNKPTQQVLANLKSRYKNKNKQKNSKLNQTKSKNISQSKEQDAFVRRNTGSSFSGINEDGMLSDNNTDRDRGSKQDQSSEKQVQNQNKKKDKKDKKSIKLHFKQIMDLQQNITDFKTKRALRDILYKCGVYRRKNKRVATDSEVDQLSQFTDIRQH